MAKVIITRALRLEVEKRFKEKSIRIFELMHALKDSPKKGKVVGAVGNIAIKELKYGKFRFYFIVNRYRVKFLMLAELQDLLIKFIRMSEKKDQQKVIEDIKRFLRGHDQQDIF